MDPLTKFSVPSQPNPDQPTPPTMSPAPKPSVVPFVICIFLLISLAGVGLLAYQNYQLNQQIASLRTVPSVSLTLTLTPTPQTKPDLAPPATANWKTYSDPNKVYEFRYPPSYSLGHYAGDSSPILLKNRIDWGITQHPAGECKGDCPVITNKRDTTINGYHATVYSGWVGSIGGETPQSFIKYDISENGAGKIEGPNYFVITLWELDRTSAAQKNYSPTRNPGIINKDDQDTFDQILSTFRFME